MIRKISVAIINSKKVEEYRYIDNEKLRRLREISRGLEVLIGGSERKKREKKKVRQEIIFLIAFVGVNVARKRKIKKSMRRMGN